MASGVLGPTGFEKRTLTEIILNVKQGMQEAFPEGIVFDESSPDTQQVGVVSDQYAEIWDFLLEIWNQLDPDNAQGIMLDRVNEGIRGVPRILNERTRCTCQMTGTPDEEIVTGSLVKSSVVTSPNFSLDASVVFDDAGNATGSFTCTEDGIFVIGAGQMDTIVTLSADWATVSNSQAAVTGVADELDADYRVRGQRSTSIRGQGYIDAVEAGIINLTGVKKVKCYENRESTTDGNGLVAKAICCFVVGGVDQDIFDLLFRKVNFGPKYIGSESGYALDWRGKPQQVKFARPTDVQMIIEVNVTEGAGWTIGKVQDIKDAIIAYFAGEQDICGLTSGYEIAGTVRSADYYPALSKMTGFFIDSIQVKKTGGSFAQSATLAWNEYPVVIDANIDVNH